MPDIPVEVAFATADKQVVINLDVPAGTTLIEAIHRSNICSQFPNLNLLELQKGVWNELKSDDHVLRAGDRVEIYRPLVVDPKEARRRRAQKVR